MELLSMAKLDKSVLAGELLNLPLDKTRTPATTTSARCTILLTELEVETACSSLKLRHPHGRSLSGPHLLAAFQAFLQRISPQETFALGVQPMSLLDIAAYLLSQALHNLLPLSCPGLGEHDTLNSLSGRLQQLLQQLAPFASMSLQQMLEDAGGSSNSSSDTTPLSLFQAGLVVASQQQGGLQAAAAAAASLDLALLLILPGSDLGSDAAPSLHLLYNSGLFHEQSAELIAQHFKVFLEAALEQPTALLLQLPLMDDAESKLVLRGFNCTDVAYDGDALVHSYFVRHAAARPDAACVVFEGRTYSYAEIDADSNRIANHLLAMDVRPGSIVGVLLLRSHTMIAALLAVLKCGAAYLPLDHHHPEARIALMLEDAGVQTVLVQPDLLHKLPTQYGQCQMGCSTLLLSAGDLGAAAAADAGWRHGQLTKSDSCCYIIYTSGSTGKPKGVAVQHAGLTAYIAWLHSNFDVTPRDVFLQKTPTNFDASVDELWAGLAAGATLVVAPPEAHRDVHSVIELISSHGVTIASFVPSQLHLLAREVLALHSPTQIAASLAPCSSLKRVLSGGEALTSTAAADITAALPRCQLWNTYGPTETTVGITSWLYTPPAAGTAPAAGSANTVPIGRGIHNSRLYVLDSNLRPVPIGVPGQLFISGVCLSGGYLNRPELNAAVFVPNPFHGLEAPGSNTQLMYRTGDLVRWLPGQHGVLEFLGRVDHQVKLRGFRIELQEIEAAIAAHPGVSQVATAVVKSPVTQQDHLAAWVSPASLIPQELLSGLASSLPPYMIPSVVVPLAALPLLPSEKVNRKALPEPDWSTHVVSVAASKPASGGAAAAADAAESAAVLASDPVMKYIQRLWAEVLNSPADSITPDSDFFAFGGNSLLVGVVNSRLRAYLDAPGMSGLLMYQNPSLQEFAAAVRAAVGLPDGKALKGAAEQDPVITVFEESCSGSGSAADLTEAAKDVSQQQGKGGVQGSANGWVFSATVQQIIGASFGLSIEFLMELVPLLTFEVLFIHWGWTALAFLPAVELALLLVYLLVAVAAKWLLIGRYKEGEQPIYGRFYILHWLANLMLMSARVYTLPLLKRTVLLNYFYRAMGMKVSSKACLQTLEFNAFDLVTIEGDACLEPHSSVGAITFTAYQQGDTYPLGTMSLKAASVGAGAVLGPQTQITSCHVPADTLVEPCTASSNPVMENSYKNPKDPAAVKTGHKPLPAGLALLAMVLFSCISSLLHMPASVASLLIWDYLSQSTEDVLDTISTALSCWLSLPGQQGQDYETCSDLMQAELLSLLPYIAFIYVTGQLVVFAMIPIKWLLLGKQTTDSVRRNSHSTWAHFRAHLFECFLDHPYVRLGAVLWSGTEVYNMWLRGLGMKVGRQAWIGEDLFCNVPDLVEIGDCVSITSGCSLFPATAATAKPIKLHPACDVTNQTALYPGVQVKPRAVVGVFTYGAQDRTFPAGSITQGCLVLRPGKPELCIPEDEEAAASALLAQQEQTEAEAAAEACNGRYISSTRYAVFNILYAISIWVLVPLTDAMFVMPLYSVTLAAFYYGGLLLLVLALPVALIAAVACLLTWLVLVKRVFLPRCEGSHPLYTYKPTAWMVYGVVLLIHEATLIRGLMGSQMGVWFYRALGAKIGKNTCILGPLYNQEPDCVTIGDGTVIDDGSFMMAHTVEERCLKFVDVNIGRYVTIGGNSCVMPGSCIKDGAFLGDVSLVMKGEVVPPGSCWSGVPAVPHARDAPTMFV